MSSLPILSSQTPNNGKIAAAKSGNTAPAADELANGAAPFGELLAKQLSPQGRDIKRDILKTIELGNSDPLAVDPSLLTGQRTDGVALPTDFLASLLPQDKRVALSDAKDAAAEPSTKAVPGLTDQADDLAPAAHRTAVTADGESKPDTRLASGEKIVPETARDKRTNSGSAPESAFTAALQAEKKAGIHAATGKTEAIILPTQTANTNTAAIGMNNVQVTAPAAQAAVTQATIATPLSQPQWADDLGQKVTWMATQRTQSAELHLNPAQLGPLEVSLKLNGDQATVQFTSAHAAVRDAIEQSIPRLRDMLADSGISLGNTTVSDQAPREQQQRGQTGGTNGNSFADNTPESGLAQVQSTTVLRRHDGVVDTFA